MDLAAILDGTRALAPALAALGGLAAAPGPLVVFALATPALALARGRAGRRRADGGPPCFPPADGPSSAPFHHRRRSNGQGRDA